MDQMILILAAGDPDKELDYRTNKTHTQIARAYLGKLVTN